MSYDKSCRKCGAKDVPLKTFTYGKGTDEEENSPLCTFCYTDESVRIHEFRKHEK